MSVMMQNGLGVYISRALVGLPVQQEFLPSGIEEVLSFNVYLSVDGADKECLCFQVTLFTLLGH